MKRTDNSHDLISVIVPAYNAEKTLMHCLNSLRNQTYSNYEIILIDDGSIDNTYELCKRASLSDKRIKVFHKTNGGIGEARNTGLKHAMGSYIAFCDSDDYVYRTWLQELWLGIKHAVDMAIVGFQCVDGYNHSFYDINSKERIYGLSDTWVLYASNLLTPVWNKLYKREIIEENNIRFTNDTDGEDGLFNLSYISRMSLGFCYNGAKIYAYVNNQESITKKYVQGMWDNAKKRMDALYTVLSALDILSDDVEREYYIKYADLIERCMFNELKYKGKTRVKADNVSKILKSQIFKTVIGKVPEKQKTKTIKLFASLGNSYIASYIFVVENQVRIQFKRMKTGF